MKTSTVVCRCPYEGYYYYIKFVAYIIKGTYEAFEIFH